MTTLAVDPKNPGVPPSELAPGQDGGDDPKGARATSRILIVDDAPAIHNDFRKILCENEITLLDAEEAALFGRSAAAGAEEQRFIMDSAYQGNEAVAMLDRALREGIRYAMAFVDVRMPPGLDGIETTERLWRIDPDLQIVICTAYSDYSCAEMIQRLGKTDRLVILKKPFDIIEVQQLANALTHKWKLLQATHRKMEDLEELVAERTEHLQQSNARLETEILRRQRREQGLLLQSAVACVLADTLTTTADPTTGILQTICEGTQWEVGELWTADRHAKVLRRAAAWPLHGSDFAEWHAANRQLTLAPGAGLPGKIWQTGQALWENDLTEEDLRCSGFAQKAGLHSFFGFPLQLQGEVLGVVNFFSREARPLEPDLVQISSTLGSLIGQAIERRRLEEHLRQSQKMDAIGYLAGGVAHDFNNILTVVQGYAQILTANPGLDSETADGLGQIGLAAERAANLTRQLLTFSRKQIMQPKPLDLNCVMGNLVKMLGRVIGEDITLRLNCSEAPTLVRADESMVSQIVMNLAVNARDAMPKGGVLTIATQDVEISEAERRRHNEARSGEFVCLTMSDTGCGIQPEHLPRIFEPFFTTKELGAGTGLGLSTVYGIVKQHRGWIEVTSQANIGTSFHIFLPRAAGGGVAAENRGSESQPGGGHETILLVEDEKPVRRLARSILQRHGYRVLEAESGPQALSIWDQHAAGIDLLLTDIVMPEGMTGRDLAQKLRSKRPELKIILTSGYSPDKTGVEAELRDGITFLQKPYSMNQLLSALRESLEKN